MDLLQCKLLVVDTVAFHIRHGFDDFTQRARALDNLATFLHGLAADFEMAVSATVGLTKCVDKYFNPFVLGGSD